VTLPLAALPPSHSWRSRWLTLFQEDDAAFPVALRLLEHQVGRAFFLLQEKIGSTTL
jgi:hypothetical protein